MSDPDLYAKIAALEERVAWLEGELRISRDTSVLSLLRNRFNLRPRPAHLLTILYQRRGKFTKASLLIDLMCPSTQDQPDIGIIKVMICHLRKGIGYPAAIINEPFSGYKIGPQLAHEIKLLIEGCS